VLAGPSRKTQRAIALVVVGATVATTVALLVGTVDGDTVAVAVGGWSAAGAGVVLVADLTAAMFLVVSMLSLGAVLVFAVGQRASDVDTPAFYPVYMVLTAGVSLAFLTSDLFTLFVAFELLLIASYILLTLGRRGDQVRSAMTYVVINLLAGALFIAAIAYLYGALGTVSMAGIAERLPEISDTTATAIMLALLAVFGIKAAVVPLHFWLPDSYPTAPTTVTAVFAGLLTKIGVYALIRTTTLFDLDNLTGVLLVVASVTMLIGVLGAIAQDDIKRILSFHIISQIGYMVLGIGLFTVSGIAAAIFFTIHQIPIKTALFMTGGLVEDRAGTSALRRIDGFAHTAPMVGVLFALAAASLAGLPPFSGFVGKLALVESGVAGGAWVPVVISLAASLLTLISMTKIWTQVFWGKPTSVPIDVAPTSGGGIALASPSRPRIMTGATAGIVAITLAIALFAGPIWDWSMTAAADLRDPAEYIGAVTGAGGTSNGS
ncbi:MAG: proton-conducting transporter membrane subunit, partial [Microthrixaceae bacterium]